MNGLYRVDDIDGNLSAVRLRTCDVLVVGGKGRLASPLLLTHCLKKKLQKLEEYVIQRPCVLVQWS